jgi:hypothetical protein
MEYGRKGIRAHRSFDEIKIEDLGLADDEMVNSRSLARLGEHYPDADREISFTSSESARSGSPSSRYSQDEEDEDDDDYEDPVDYDLYLNAYDATMSPPFNLSSPSEAIRRSSSVTTIPYQFPTSQQLYHTKHWSDESAKTTIQPIDHSTLEELETYFTSPTSSTADPESPKSTSTDATTTSDSRTTQKTVVGKVGKRIEHQRTSSESALKLGPRSYGWI